MLFRTYTWTTNTIYNNKTDIRVLITSNMKNAQPFCNNKTLFIDNNFQSH